MLPITSKAQTDIPLDTINVDSAQAVKLGLFNKENRKTFKILFSGKPARAGLYSLLFPGGGQAYNRTYWKIPIIWAAVGGTAYLAIQSGNRYSKMNTAYKCMKRGETCNYEGITSAVQLRPYLDDAHLASERAWVTFSLVYLVQAIWAYIDRHLIDFDLNEDLSFKPQYNQGTFNLGLNINIASKKNNSRTLQHFRN